MLVVCESEWLSIAAGNRLQEKPRTPPGIRDWMKVREHPGWIGMTGPGAKHS